MPPIKIDKTFQILRVQITFLTIATQPREHFSIPERSNFANGVRHSLTRNPSVRREPRAFYAGLEGDILKQRARYRPVLQGRSDQTAIGHFRTCRANVRLKSDSGGEPEVRLRGSQVRDDLLREQVIFS